MMLRALAALAALVLSVSQVSAQDLDKVTIAGWSKPISEITNILAEPDKGFFKAHGIELGYVPGTGGGSAITNMLSGAADVAFTDPASLYQALDQGEDLVAIYNIYPQNVFNVVAPVGRGIETAADLKGKTIGVYSLNSGTRQNLLFLLHQVGLTEQDVTIQVTGLLNFGPVIQGQVDATAATDTGLYIGRLNGLGEVNVINVADSLNVPTDVFVVTRAYYEANKPILRRFLQAYRDSAQWMIDNPQEAAKIAVTRSINGRDEAVNLGIIELRNLSAQSETTRTKGLGHFDVDVLQDGADAFLAQGLISSALDMRRVVVTDLIPE
ncbi:NitT/TauT family transport system substrate-binding protein [Roseovarius litoreus]|uniref:Thiamine pyrimidine synthase n=1 Tax=Roseovarius litoreus TaxID=1155722 RepID=A0A1M7KUN0_9RHOB|nr:ABC transporter substrate-binding protein [Roseovarius litoreus]SHM69268.1 NitT/TauT family transport system substrate-binding protein [Roseovarius litoreus]